MSRAGGADAQKEKAARNVLPARAPSGLDARAGLPRIRRHAEKRILGARCAKISAATPLFPTLPSMRKAALAWRIDMEREGDEILHALTYGQAACGRAIAVRRMAHEICFSLKTSSWTPPRPQRHALDRWRGEPVPGHSANEWCPCNTPAARSRRAQKCRPMATKCGTDRDISSMLRRYTMLLFLIPSGVSARRKRKRTPDMRSGW